MVDKMSATLKKNQKEIDRLTKEVEKLNKANKKQSKSSKKSGQSMKAVAMKAAAGAAAVYGMYKSVQILGEKLLAAVKPAAEFETGMARIGTLLGNQAQELMPALAESVDDLAVGYGKAAKDVQGAMFQAISAGVDASEATQFMEVAAEAAVGGFTDMETAVDGLTNVVNAYGLSSEEARDIANSTFAANKYGKTTFKEIASSIGKVAPIAASLGVDFDSLAATIVATTKAGISTKESVTGIRGALTNVIKPTKDAAKLAADLGIEFSSSALKAKGWHAFLSDIMAKTGGNTDALATLIPNVRGLATVMAAASETGLKDMAVALDDMATDATTVSDAFKLVAVTHEHRMKQIAEAEKKRARERGELFKSEAEGWAKAGASADEFGHGMIVMLDKYAFVQGGYLKAIGKGFLGWTDVASDNMKLMDKAVAEMGDQTKGWAFANHQLIEGMRDALEAGADWGDEIDKLRAKYAATYGLTLDQAFATGEAAQTLTEEAAAFATSTEACLEHAGVLVQATDGTWRYTEAALAAKNASNEEGEAFEFAAQMCTGLGEALDTTTDRERAALEAAERARKALQKYKDEAKEAAKEQARRAKATRAAAKADREAKEAAEALADEMNRTVLAQRNLAQQRWDPEGTYGPLLEALQMGLPGAADAAREALAMEDLHPRVAKMVEGVIAEYEKVGALQESIGGQLPSGPQIIPGPGDRPGGTGEKTDVDAQRKTLAAQKQAAELIRMVSGEGVEGVTAFNEALDDMAMAGVDTELVMARLAKTMGDVSLDTMVSAEVFMDAGKAMGEGLAAGTGQAITAFLSGQEAFGTAMANMTKDVLFNLAEQATANAIMETAKGVAALAGVLTAPLAPGHFAAAKAFAAVAAFGFAGGAAIHTAQGGSFGAPEKEKKKKEDGTVADVARETGKDPFTTSAPPVIINAHFSGQPIVNKAQIGKAIDDALGAAEREGMTRPRRSR